MLYTVFYNTEVIFLQNPSDQRKRITGRYFRECVLCEVNQSYTRIRPNTALRGSKIVHDY